MAALKPTVDSLETVPEAARGFYEAKDGKFVLALDGAPAGFVSAADLATANGKVVEFRDKNIALLQEVEPLRKIKTDLGDTDPKAAKDAIAAQAALKGKGVQTPDDIDARVAAALKPVQDALAAQAAQTQAANKRADDQALGTKVRDAFGKAGGKAKAADYIVDKARESFTVVDGAVVALPNKFSANRPGEPLGLDEWLVSAAKDHDFAFEPSSGSGATATKGGGTPARAGQTVLRNPTPSELGAASDDIAKGKVRVEITT